MQIFMHRSVTLVLLFGFMKCSPKCRSKKLGMIYSILESFCSFLNWEGADIRHQIRPRKIPVVYKGNNLRHSIDVANT